MVDGKLRVIKGSGRIARHKPESPGNSNEVFPARKIEVDFGEEDRRTAVEYSQRGSTRKELELRGPETTGI